MFNWELKDDALKTWIRLRQASEVMEKVLETDLDRQGSTLTQVDVLSILDASKTALTPGEIADYTFRQQHSASAQLSRMWRSGLVKKTRSKVKSNNRSNRERKHKESFSEKSFYQRVTGGS